jgi:predicted transposase YbfD/YdcC
LLSCPIRSTGSVSGSCCRFSATHEPTTRPRRYPTDTTDAQWAVIDPLLPDPGCIQGRGGRREKHTPYGILFPHARPAVRITRSRTTNAKTNRETAYFTVSLPAGDALPADLQDWIRREWLIENHVHHVRDVTFREDLHQARTGTGPAVIATLRNTAIGWHRTNGDTTIARALRRANRRSHDLITAVTSSYPTTQ